MAASISLLAPVVHSGLDYPLRSGAIACYAAACLAILISRRDVSPGQEKYGEKRQLQTVQDFAGTSTRAQASRRPAIRLQAHGESLDPFRADRIFALDERLTRQFGKTLAMLIRLREISAPGPAS